MYRAVCGLTRKAVIIKAYQKSKMKEKNVLRMEREIVLMRKLGDDPSIVQVGSHTFWWERMVGLDSWQLTGHEVGGLRHALQSRLEVVCPCVRGGGCGGGVGGGGHLRIPHRMAQQLIMGFRKVGRVLLEVPILQETLYVLTYALPV